MCRTYGRVSEGAVDVMDMTVFGLVSRPGMPTISPPFS